MLGLKLNHDSKRGLWWHHDMTTISALLTTCEGNPLITKWFFSQKASNEELGCFDFFCNKPMNRHSSRQWFMSIWRHLNATALIHTWCTYICIYIYILYCIGAIHTLFHVFEFDYERNCMLLLFRIAVEIIHSQPNVKEGVCYIKMLNWNLHLNKAVEMYRKNLLFIQWLEYRILFMAAVEFRRY